MCVGSTQRFGSNRTVIPVVCGRRESGSKINTKEGRCARGVCSTPLQRAPLSRRVRNVSARNDIYMRNAGNGVCAIDVVAQQNAGSSDAKGVGLWVGDIPSDGEGITRNIGRTLFVASALERH